MFKNQVRSNGNMAILAAICMTIKWKTHSEGPINRPVGYWNGVMKRAQGNLASFTQLETTTLLHLNEMQRQMGLWEPKSNFKIAVEWLYKFSEEGRDKIQRDYISKRHVIDSNLMPPK